MRTAFLEVHFASSSALEEKDLAVGNACSDCSAALRNTAAQIQQSLEDAYEKSNSRG